MTDVNHSQVLVGSRHAIHNLTYTNAANRIAGTNEGKGIVPLTINNLWQVAKQDDDDSLWMCVDTAPLTWDQIMTGTSGNLDVGYNAFGGAGTVTIDAGSLTWAPTGAYDMVVDVDNAGSGNGFKVENASAGHYFRAYHNTAGATDRLFVKMEGVLFQINSDSVIFDGVDFNVATSNQIYMEAATYSELIVTGAVEDLNFGARGATIFLNESGQETLSGAFSATSLVGGLNEVMGGGLGVFTGAVSITKAGTVKTNADFLSLTNTANAVDMDGTSTGVLWNQWYYDGVTPSIADAGRIAVGTEQDWTSTASTQDSYMAFETALDGTVSEKVRITGAGVLKVGGGTPGTATGAGDLFVSGKLEANSTIQGFSVFVENNATISGLDPSGLGAIRFRNTAQNPDSMTLEVGSLTNSIVMIQYGDAGYDFAHALQTTPTLFFQSDAQSATEWGSLTHDGDYFRFNTGAGSVCIGTGTPGVATGAGSLYVTDALEVDGVSYLDHVQINDSKNISAASGTVFPSIQLANGTQNAATGLLLTGTTANNWIICEAADKNYNFAHALQTNPTLFGHSASQSTTEWWSLTHNQTDAVLATGAGGLSLAPASGEVILPDAGKIVYDIAPASDTTATGDITSSTVDSNATGIGAALYQAADGNWDEADASALVTMPCRALAIEAGTGTKKILRRGWIRDDSWSWTPGGPVYVSTTTGALTQTKPSATGNQVQIVGYAETADVLDFNPASFILEVA